MKRDQYDLKIFIDKMNKLKQRMQKNLNKKPICISQNQYSSMSKNFIAFESKIIGILRSKYSEKGGVINVERKN